MPDAPLPAPEDKRASVQDMFDRISDRYDLVNRIMTFGLDQRWRRKLVRSLELPRGSRVLDIACGTGDLCDILLDEDLAPVGVDLSFGMLRNAHTSAPLAQADGLALPFPDASFVGITCGFALRNVTDLNALFSECARVLAPGGRVGFLEVDEPVGKIPRWGHRVYFHKIVPKIGGALSDREAYRYLPASTAYLPPHRELAALLDAAGFVRLERRSHGAGAAQAITATRG
jgi:demethylmenaquinone methyltransferase / 2-methoxy-6-polyprenyl-1,4-benzoquinol methylase